MPSTSTTVRGDFRNRAGRDRRIHTGPWLQRHAVSSQTARILQRLSFTTIPSRFLKIASGSYRPAISPLHLVSSNQ